MSKEVRVHVLVFRRYSRRQFCSPVPICLEWIVPPLPFRKRISLLEADKLVQVEQSIEENTGHLQSLRLQEVLQMHMDEISPYCHAARKKSCARRFPLFT